MRKGLLAMVLVAFVVTGCTGSFNLTRKVYNFHRSQSDKWADELCFLLVAITPIYGLATFADAIVFNSIEFWTGENPVTMSQNQDIKTKIVRQGEDELIVAYDAKSDQVVVTPNLSNRKRPALVFERTDKMILAKNTQGQLLFSSVRNDNGDVLVYDGNGRLVKNYTAQQVAALKEQFLKN